MHHGWALTSNVLRFIARSVTCAAASASPRRWRPSRWSLSGWLLEGRSRTGRSSAGRNKTAVFYRTPNSQGTLFSHQPLGLWGFDLNTILTTRRKKFLFHSLPVRVCVCLLVWKVLCVCVCVYPTGVFSRCFSTHPNELQLLFTIDLNCNNGNDTDPPTMCTCACTCARRRLPPGRSRPAWLLSGCSSSVWRFSAWRPAG